MVRSHLNNRYRLTIIALLFLLFSAHHIQGQEATEEAPEPPIIVTSEPFEMTFGPGPFDLLQPAKGLADLASYQAMLTVTFDGRNAGGAQAWSSTYTLLVTASPPARQLTIEQTGNESRSVYIAEIGDARYEQRDGETCVMSGVQAGSSLSETWELAGLLDSVIGADEAGADIVNDVAVAHYTFDERAQGSLGSAEMDGELWVSADGSHLVRYRLTTTGGEDYFGNGIEGTTTWDYQLADVNQPLTLALPDDCPPLPPDLPAMADAADVVRLPGFMSYSTASPIPDVVAFYQDQVATLGGQPSSPPIVNEELTLFGLVLDDRSFLLIASSGDAGGTQVELHQVDDQTQLAIAEEVPSIASTPVPSPGGEIPVCSGEANTALILADATNVQVLTGTGVISYTTSLSIPDIVAYYQEQVTALGGQVSSPMPATDFLAMLEVRGETAYMVIVDALDGMNSVSITATNLMQPLSVCVVAPNAEGDETTSSTPVSGTETPQGCAVSVDSLALLPDAMGIQSFAGSVTYTSTMPMAEAAAFYEQELVALGAQPSPSPMPSSDFMATLVYNLGDQLISVIILPIDQQTTSVTMTITSTNPFGGSSTPCPPRPS